MALQHDSHLRVDTKRTADLHQPNTHQGWSTSIPIDRPSPITRALLGFSACLIFVLIFSGVGASAIGSSKRTEVRLSDDFFRWALSFSRLVAILDFVSFLST